MMPSISYAIAVWNEHKELDRLLTQLKQFITVEDEIVIQADSKVTQEVIDVINKHGLPLNIYSLNNDFATFKNHLKSLCTKDYIFQLDADEFLCENLLYNLKDIIKDNPNIDTFSFPRINVLVDENKLEEYINQSNWQKDTCRWVNYPDSQTRLFKNKTDIYYERPVHELLNGYNSNLNLENENYHIIHIKSLQRMNMQHLYYTNNFYNKNL
jgi:glycosyltransferase involved in cell wall biosynthesis